MKKAEGLLQPAEDDRLRLPLGAKQRRGGLVMALVLVGMIVAAVHWPVLSGQALALDDDQFVTSNPLVTHPGWSSAERFFAEVLHPSTVYGYYCPLSMVSLMLDYARGGRPENLHAFHTTSLALHVVSVSLILVLLYRLFGALGPAAIAALLFGLHPLGVEPIAWIGERKTLLAAAFALASILCYVHAGHGRRAWLIPSLLLYLLALLSKPTVVALPLLLVLLDYWPLRRLDGRAVIEKWHFLVLSAASSVVALISHQRSAGISVASGGDLLHWPLRVGYLIGFYLRKVVYPSNLSPIYPDPGPFVLSNRPAVFGTMAVLVLTCLVILAARRSRGPLTGWLFFLIALSPTLGLVQYSWVIASDKYLYFPVLGLLLPLAYGIAVFQRSLGSRWAARAAPLVLAAPLLAAEARGVRTSLGHWSDSVTLFRHIERIVPNSPVVESGLGLALARTTADDEAIRHYQRALELKPGDAGIHRNLGILLAERGRTEESIEHFRQVVQLQPADAAAACRLGASLAQAGRVDEAESEFRRVLGLEPRNLEALERLGNALMSQGRKVEAVEQFRKAASIAPANAALQFKLARALLEIPGGARDAAHHLQLAVRARPDGLEAINSLAWLLATSPDPAIRDGAEALRLAERVVKLTGGHGDPLLLDTWAAAQAAAGQFDRAARTETVAIETARSAHLDDSTTRGFRVRLGLYQRGLSYQQTSDAP